MMNAQSRIRTARRADRRKDWGRVLGVVLWSSPTIGAAADQVEIELVRGAEPRVGRAAVTVRAWDPVHEQDRALRAWGARSVRARVPLDGRSLSIFLDWAADADRPAQLFWSEVVADPTASRPAVVHEEALKWGDGPVAMAKVVFAAGSTQLLLTHQGSAIFATWYADATYHAAFALAQQEHLAWFVDGDLDGALEGPDDRWIAGPAVQLTRLQLANPHVEMRPLDEPWSLGDVQLRVVEARGARATLEVGAVEDRAGEIARHYARVQTDSERAYPARSLMLDKQGEDPARPAAQSRVQWHHARSIDEALAFARATPRPLLVEFTSFSCTYCRLLGYVTHPDAEVDAVLRRFTCVRIIAETDPERTWERLGVGGFPSTVWIDADGAVRAELRGFVPPSRFVETLRGWLDE